MRSPHINLSDLGLSGKELVNLDTEKDGVVSFLEKQKKSRDELPDLEVKKRIKKLLQG
jgi:hypothetical protein